MMDKEHFRLYDPKTGRYLREDRCEFTYAKRLAGIFTDEDEYIEDELEQLEKEPLSTDEEMNLLPPDDAPRLPGF